jgi:hypothetical protein
MLTIAGELKELGIPLFVLGPPVVYRESLPEILANLTVRELHSFDTTRFVMPNRFAFDEKMASMLAGLPGLIYISVIRQICEGLKCTVAVNGNVPVQFDMLHLTAEGSLFVASKLVPLIIGQLRRAPHG